MKLLTCMCVWVGVGSEITECVRECLYVGACVSEGMGGRRRTLNCHGGDPVLLGTPYLRAQPLTCACLHLCGRVLGVVGMPRHLQHRRRCVGTCR